MNLEDYAHVGIIVLFVVALQQLDTTKNMSTMSIKLVAMETHTLSDCH